MSETLTETELRVRRVMALMTSANWVPGASHQALAQEWGVSLTVVKTIAAEAHRLLRFVANEDRDQLRDILLAGIESVRIRSRTRKRSYVRKDGTLVTVDDPDFATELHALELMAKMHGLLANKLEVTTGTPLDQQFAGWTEEELERFASDGTVPPRFKATTGERDGMH